MMNIALVTPYDYPYPGGVTEHVRHLDREFRKRGHETRILAPSTVPQVMLAANVIPVTDQVQPIPFNGSIARIALSPDVPHLMEEILHDERFDVVHLHEPAAPVVSLSALYYSHALNVGTFHAYSEHRELFKHAQPLMQWVDARLDGRIFVSTALRDSLAPYLSGEYRLIPNGIDYLRFAAPEIKPIAEFDDGRPNLLFVGRLDERKGFRHLLRAFASIQPAVPDARLLVVGAFDEQDAALWREYACANHLRDVHFIGRVSEEELSSYYRAATLFCAPSTGGESFGIVLLEAMAAGLPVVASSIAGYRNVMQDQVQGCLVPPGDEKALGQSIIALLRSPQRRAEMAAQGRATAARYDWKLVAPRVLNYYEELLARRARRRARHFAMPASRRTPQDQKVNVMNVALGGVMSVFLPLISRHLW